MWQYHRRRGENQEIIGLSSPFFVVGEMEVENGIRW